MQRKTKRGEEGRGKAGEEQEQGKEGMRKEQRNTLKEVSEII